VNLSTEQYQDHNVKRTFIIGDEWLYYKLYTGKNTADTLLLTCLYPLIEDLLQKKVIDKWFFIRYGDPDFHLRVRVHLSGISDVSSVIMQFNPELNKLFDQGFIWKVQLDTYDREIERYHPLGIGLAEELFFHDSEQLIGLLKLNLENENMKWLMALKSIDSFMNALNFGIEEKLLIMESFKNEFQREFGIVGKYKRQIDKKYRQNRKLIEDFLRVPHGGPENWDPVINLIKKTNNQTKEPIHSLLSIQNKIGNDFPKLFGGVIHMSMNRIFKSMNRLHEAVCYDFLYRFYRSSLAQQKSRRQKNRVESAF